MDPKPAILILCTGNSCRSQMAAGFFRAWAGERFDVHSAGTEPKDAVHPLAVQAMAEIGIDISAHRPKSLNGYLGHLPVRHLFIVCGGAEQKCPRIFPGVLTRTFWPFDDPAEFDGTPEATLEKFRHVRDQIAAKVKAWLEALDVPTSNTLADSLGMEYRSSRRD